MLEIAIADEYLDVTIYYHDWAIDLRARMTPFEVRESYMKKLTIRDERSLRKFMAELPIDTMSQMSERIDKSDIRLVIDFLRPDGM